jgi:hypothetical protein
MRPIPDHQEVFVNVSTDASIIIELLDLERDVGEPEILSYYFNQLAADNDVAPDKCHTFHTIQLMNDRFMPTIDANEEELSFTRMVIVGKQYAYKYRNKNKHQSSQQQQSTTRTDAVHNVRDIRPGDEGEDLVYIIMTLVRLRNVDSDVLITCNLPLTHQRSFIYDTYHADHPNASPLSTEEIDAAWSAVNIEDLLTASAEPETGLNDLQLASMEKLLEIFPEVRDFARFLDSFRINDWSLFVNE